MSDNLKRFDLNPPAGCDQLLSVETHFLCRLPGQYRAFMMKHDGGEGFIGKQYLILWRTCEIVEFNIEYEVSIYAPGLLLFGSSGGGEAFAFDLRDASLVIVMVPFIGMCLNDAIPLAKSFDEFISRIANGQLL